MVLVITRPYESDGKDAKLCLVIKLFEQKLCRFLWNGKDDGVARATVAWKFLCLPKREGGLGIKKLE